ncbi:MAG: Sapep family Mn(2+)-dependent dipeptidase [Eggerthellaceae bacterium]|nr:Sapep family Mn(2+)-dependent dipeptidase [Eggerthellaceae bacterium]
MGNDFIDEFAHALSDVDVDALIDDYITNNRESFEEDLGALISIESVQDLDNADASLGMPFGPGPAAALDTVLAIASRMGFETCNDNGYIGWAQLEGQSDEQLGIIAHTDVVASSNGWICDPFSLTVKDGFYVGRGVIDDKGPLMVVLHALNMWKKYLDDKGLKFPYTVRYLFGCAEETGMEDVKYYLAKHPSPLFLFTPDAEFPVCYGEKGMVCGWFVSDAVRKQDRVIQDIKAGAAFNAVPDFAYADVLTDKALANTDSVKINKLDNGLCRIEASGKSAHASTPWLGINALGILIDYLLEFELCSPKEKLFLKLASDVLACHDASKLGIGCEDEFFGKLTGVAAMVACEDADDEHSRLKLSFDVRYPTCTTAERIIASLSDCAEEVGGIFEVRVIKKPFVIDPDYPGVKALMTAYNEVTGEDAKPFTMGGGTYARMFEKTTSFGMDSAVRDVPAWAGGMHGPNEAISIEWVKKSFRIYAHALKNMNCTHLASVNGNSGV